ncbi:hypothetical protein HMPREF2736_07760 [Corynebacterium sp. HMSC036E10]|nr:hypothetical protein HMPREF2736_07760 [Corynebacterium sp. HMSC036E10]
MVGCGCVPIYGVGLGLGRMVGWCSPGLWADRLAGLVMLLDGLVLVSVFALVVLGLFVVMGLIV